MVHLLPDPPQIFGVDQIRQTNLMGHQVLSFVPQVQLTVGRNKPDRPSVLRWPPLKNKDRAIHKKVLDLIQHRRHGQDLLICE